MPKLDYFCTEKSKIVRFYPKNDKIRLFSYRKKSKIGLFYPKNAKIGLFLIQKNPKAGPDLSRKIQKWMGKLSKTTR